MVACRRWTRRGHQVESQGPNCLLPLSWGIGRIRNHQVKGPGGGVGRAPLEACRAKPRSACGPGSTLQAASRAPARAAWPPVLQGEGCGQGWGRALSHAWPPTAPPEPLGSPAPLGPAARLCLVTAAWTTKRSLAAEGVEPPGLCPPLPACPRSHGTCHTGLWADPRGPGRASSVPSAWPQPAGGEAGSLPASLPPLHWP